ncbi:glycosyltransferase family 2 protein [Salegentibacter sp. UBA1130]|uniref:glycosyltransferase family 2 protein n=1 Tax=Salegentibacter sp. UBA1130 TaxID=1947451 RepID=UPI00257C7B99|nr:glycosyltransferase family 2 protein [Salegentibacter sp. UBA1130]
MILQTQDLITIITPTYNRAHIISRAIESVLSQTYENWEYIIVDDASSDNTKEVVESFKDNRIKYIACKENGGNAVARNVGVNAAKGKYIAFLDSDDEYLPVYLEKALSKLSSNDEADFLWSGTRTVAIDRSYSESIWIPKSKRQPDQFLYELHVGIGRGFLINRKCFSDLNFDERLRTAVDTDFLIRLRMKFQYTILEEILLYIHTQPGSVRSDFSEKKKSYAIIIDKHKKLIEADKYLRFKWYYKLFWLSLYDGDFHLGKKAYLKIKYIGLKPSFLWAIFKIFPKKTAIKLHKKLSN